MNNSKMYEVYTHTNIHTGTPFYVGSGVIGRAKEIKNRNLDWGREVDLLGMEYDINIVAVYDNVTDAREHEDMLIRMYGLRKHGGLLTNQKFFTKGGPVGYKWTTAQLEKKSEVMTEVQNRPEVKDAIRIAQCNFYFIELATGEYFITNGGYEGSRILKKMGYDISTVTIHSYAKYNADPESIIYYTKYGRYTPIYIRYATQNEIETHIEAQKQD